MSKKTVVRISDRLDMTAAVLNCLTISIGAFCTPKHINRTVLSGLAISFEKKVLSYERRSKRSCTVPFLFNGNRCSDNLIQFYITWIKFINLRKCSIKKDVR